MARKTTLVMLFVALATAAATTTPAAAPRPYLAYVAEQLPLFDAAWDAQGARTCVTSLGKAPCDGA